MTWPSWDPPLLSLFFSLSSISFLSSITWAFQCSSVFSCYRLSLCSSPNLSYFSFLSPHFSSATFFFFFLICSSSSLWSHTSTSSFLLHWHHCLFFPAPFIHVHIHFLLFSYGPIGKHGLPFLTFFLSFFLQFPFIPCLFISFPLLYYTLLPFSFFSSASLKSSSLCSLPQQQCFVVDLTGAKLHISSSWPWWKQ